MNQSEDEQYSCIEEFFLDSCRYGDYDDAIGCFEDNVDVSWVDDRINNCIHMAAANGHVEIIEQVLNYIEQHKEKFDKQKIINQQNQDGNTPLHWAAINNQVKVTEILLSKGVDANIKNNFNRTALDEALILEKPEIAELVVKHTKADLNDYQEEAKMNTQVYDITKEDLEDLDTVQKE